MSGKRVGIISCLLVLALFLAACAQTRSSSRNRRKSSVAVNAKDLSGDYGAAVSLGKLEDAAIKESSGLASSSINPDILWTHNDSGDGPFLFAIDRRGRRRGTFRVTNAEARDWEDIARGPGTESGRSYLYIGDIGDNREGRREITVYRIPEPQLTPEDSSTTLSNPRQTEVAEVIRLRYPDKAHDAETLMVHPVSGDLYILTKVSFDNPVLYKTAAPLNTSGVTTLTRVMELKIPSVAGGLITGGDISQDGTRAVLCDYGQAYEMVLSEGGAEGKNFDAIWKQPVKIVPLGEREQGEAICYRADSRALLATSEGTHSPLIEVARR